MSSKAPKVKASPMEATLADVARQQQARAVELQRTYEDPLRGILQPQLFQALGQNNPFQTELSAPERQNIESQFGQAQNSLLNTAERGGRLRSMMAGLERDRAMDVGAASNEARQRGIGRAFQVGAGSLPTTANIAGLQQQGMGGMQNVAASQLARNTTNAQAQQQASNSKGAGMGSLAGAGLSAAMMMSSRNFKEAIEPFADDVLAMLEQTPVYTWRYLGEDRQHIGPITEEAPSIIVSDDGKALVPIDYLGFMFAAIKALTKKVAALEGLSHAV